MPFLDVNVKPLCTTNHVLAEFTLILTVFYHPLTELARFVDCFIGISGFAQIGLSFTKN